MEWLFGDMFASVVICDRYVHLSYDYSILLRITFYDYIAPCLKIALSLLISMI